MPGLYENLGLRCNPFKRALAEQDPCDIIIVGRKHRHILQRITASLTDWNEPSWVYLVSGHWGAGKTAVTRRAVCEAREVAPLDIYVQISELPVIAYPTLVAHTALKALRSLYKSREKYGRSKDTELASKIIESLEKRYPMLARYVRCCHREISVDNILKPLCTRFDYYRCILELLSDCGSLSRLVGETIGLLQEIALNTKRPIYIIYDQFEQLFTRIPPEVYANICKDMDTLFEFKRDFIKELLHKFTLSREEGFLTKIVVAEALHINYLARYITEFVEQKQDPRRLLGNYDAIELEPFSELEETRALIEEYLKQSGCREKGTSIEPFSEDAIAELHNWSRGLPRAIVSLANHVIEYYASEGLTPPITGERVRLLAVRERVGPAPLRCLGFEDVYIKVLEEASNPADMLFRALIDNYLLLRSQYSPVAETAEEALPEVRWAEKKRYIIFQKLEGASSDKYVTLLALVKKKVSNVTVSNAINMLRNALSALKIPPSSKDYVTMVNILVLADTPPVSKAAQEAISQAYREGIRVNLIPVKHDVFAKLTTACILFYKEKQDELKALTLEEYLRMIETGYQVTPFST